MLSGAVKSFAKALGVVTDTALQQDHPSLRSATKDESHAKRIPSDKMYRTGSETTAFIGDDARHSDARQYAIAAGRAASEQDLARRGKLANRHSSRSAPKINFLNEDMLGGYEVEGSTSQVLKGHEAPVNPKSNACGPSDAGDYENLKSRYSKLKKTLHSLNIEASKLNNENSQIKAENRTLEEDNRTIEDWLLRPYAEATGHKKYTRSMCSDMIREALTAKALEKEHCHYLDQIVSMQMKEKSLQEQVDALQQELLSNVEKASIVSDEHFSQEFRWLASSIKTLSRNISLPAEIELADIAAINSARLLKNVNKAHWSGRGRKKASMEAFVWSVLISGVFSSPFEISGPYCAPEIEGWWAKLFRNAHDAAWPPPGDLVERWRCMTVEQVVKLGGKETITHGVSTEQGANVRQDIVNSILKGRKDVYMLITETLGGLSPATDFPQVPAIIDKAFSLALEMNLQRCRLQVVHPEIGGTYLKGEPSYLKSVLDDEEVEEGTVAFIFSPGLVKWGDGHGKNLNQELVLVPCEVIIAPALNDTASTEPNVSSSGA